MNPTDIVVYTTEDIAAMYDRYEAAEPQPRHATDPDDPISRAFAEIEEWDV